MASSNSSIVAADGTSGWFEKGHSMRSQDKHFRSNALSAYAPVAQLDRAPDFESVPPRSESLDNSTQARKHWAIQDHCGSLKTSACAQWLALWLAPVRLFRSCSVLPIPSLESSQEHAPAPTVPSVTSRFSLRSVRMYRFACRVVLASLILSSAHASAQPFSASSTTPNGTNPACTGFDPYTWTRAQIETCLPGSWPVNGFSPYNGLGQPLFEPVKVQAWANVLVGAPGLENDYYAFLTLENDTEANVAHVIIRGGANGVIQRMIFLDPDQRIVEQLNSWPELAGQLPIGISVRVRWMKEGNAGVAMHRARDFGSMVQAVEGGGR